ncbi:hypothetical protein P355_0615 [Burkholderia cenocepacia KC-01]|nr:hypothetical protein P355_0615 [Burkholderia cenocepacia KC-01]
MHDDDVSVSMPRGTACMRRRAWRLMNVRMVRDCVGRKAVRGNRRVGPAR